MDRKHSQDNESDFGERLRRLEKQEEYEMRVRMDRYEEGSGKWQNWILTVVGSLIVAGIGAVVYELADLKSTMAASLARQEMDEKRLDRVESRVFRGAP